MKPNLKVAAAIIGLAAVVSYALSRPPALVNVGRPAPRFELAGLNGQTVSLSSYRGKLVLVNFWASWCPECREEFPTLEAAYKKHRAEGFEIIGVSVDEQGRKAVMPFIAAADPSFTICLADPKTSDAYGVRGLPSSFLVDRSGVVVKSYLGAIEPSELENDIVEQLSRRGS